MERIAFGKCFLFVDGKRIVYERCDSFSLQIRLELIPSFCFDNEQVENVVGRLPRTRRANFGDYLQFFPIYLCESAALCVVCIEFLQLDRQYRRMQLVEPAIETHYRMFVSIFLSVIPDHVQLLCHFGIVRSKGTRIAVGPEIFCRIETPAADAE